MIIRKDNMLLTFETWIFLFEMGKKWKISTDIFEKSKIVVSQLKNVLICPGMKRNAKISINRIQNINLNNNIFYIFCIKWNKKVEESQYAAVYPHKSAFFITKQVYNGSISSRLEIRVYHTETKLK